MEILWTVFYGKSDYVIIDLPVFNLDSMSCVVNS